MGKLKAKSSRYLKSINYLTREETMKEMLNKWEVKRREITIPLEESINCFSAEDIKSTNTLPVCRSAKMDGVAVRYVDFKNGNPDYINWIEGVDYVSADMGDDFDDAFDTVIPIENFSFNENGRISNIDMSTKVEKGQRINYRGDSVKEDESVISKNDLITPFRMGLLAASGIKEIKVIDRIKIAYIPTGSELIDFHKKPERGQNIETNSLMLKELIKNLGGELIIYPIIVDDENLLEEAFKKALNEADIVLINGGTSMGTEDYNSKMIEKNSSFYQHGVRCIPGIPVAMSIVDNIPVVNLPGPPFAAFCANHWCVKKLIEHWYNYGFSENIIKDVKLKKDIKKPKEYEMYIRLEIYKDENGEYSAYPLQGNIRYSEMARRWNGLFVAPIGSEIWNIGDTIDIEMI